MRILVTGASGFVGRLFCNAAIAHGLDVIATDRRPVEVDPGCERTIVKDMMSLAASDLDPPVDAVIHFATGKSEYLVDGGSATDEARYHAVLTETVDGTQHVCRVAESAGVRRFIHVSSMTVYPGPVPQDVRAGTAVFDSHPEWRGLYAHSKILAEAAVQNLASNHALAMEVCILRLALVCGPGMGNAAAGAKERDRVLRSTLISTAKPLSTGLAVGIGSPAQAAPLLDVRDLIRGLLALIDQTPRRGAVRVWDVQSGVPPLKRELLRGYATASGRRYRQIWAPRNLMVAGAWLAEGLFRLRGKREHFPYRIGRAYRFNAEALPSDDFWRDLEVQPRGTLETCLDVAVMESMPNVTVGEPALI